METTREKYSYKASKERKKKFVRYKEGAELYSMGISKFQEIAKDAGAVHKVGQLCLVNIEKLDEYLESFAIPADSGFYKNAGY